LTWIYVLVDSGFSSLCDAFFLFSLFSQDIPATWSVPEFLFCGAISYVPAISCVTIILMRARSTHHVSHHETAQPNTANTKQIYRKSGSYIGAPSMSGKTAGAPALAPEIIMPCFEHFCLPDPVSKLLQGDTDFRRFGFQC
jgi:hypothetical protein